VEKEPKEPKEGLRGLTRFPVMLMLPIEPKFMLPPGITPAHSVGVSKKDPWACGRAFGATKPPVVGGNNPLSEENEENDEPEGGSVRSPGLDSDSGASVRRCFSGRSDSAGGNARKCLLDPLLLSSSDRGGTSLESVPAEDAAVFAEEKVSAVSDSAGAAGVELVEVADSVLGVWGDGNAGSDVGGREDECPGI